MIEFYTVSIKNVMFRDLKYFVLTFAGYYVLITLNLFCMMGVYFYTTQLNNSGRGAHLLKNLGKGVDKKLVDFRSLHLCPLLSMVESYVSIITS